MMCPVSSHHLLTPPLSSQEQQVEGSGHLLPTHISIIKSPTKSIKTQDDSHCTGGGRSLPLGVFTTGAYPYDSYDSKQWYDSSNLMWAKVF